MGWLIQHRIAGIEEDPIWISKTRSKGYIEVPDMVKIDVEGHEDEVLRGGLETLANRKTTLIIELHSVQLRRPGVDPTEYL